jgi:ectoine hydroxylase-related dioxygenase (phytanoyl-CoA dioxygenase family)
VLSRRETFQSKGFLIAEDFLSSADCDAVLSAFDSERNGKAGRRDLINKPVIKRFAYDHRISKLVYELAGEPSVPYKATIFDKSSDCNWLVPWHQDRSLPFNRRFDGPGWGPWTLKDGISFALAPRWALDNVIALRIHLDDSTAENGPLRLIEGSHALGVIDQAQVVAFASSSSYETCTVRKGGIIAMHPLLIHSSSRSHDTTPRRILHIEYSACREFPEGIKLGSN